LAHFQSKTVKGEIVIVLEGKPDPKLGDKEEENDE